MRSVLYLCCVVVHIYVNTCIYIEEGCVYEECPVSLLCGCTYLC